MRKIGLFVLLFVLVSFYSVMANETIKGPIAEKMPPPEKCSACHEIQNTHQELLQSAHKDLKCLDCHLPGSVQKQKYQKQDLSFSRLGYHQTEGVWAELSGNEACLRCHSGTGMQDTKQKCWSCHMPEIGIDKVILVKDRALPPTGDNIAQTKELPHLSHRFKNHSKVEAGK